MFRATSIVLRLSTRSLRPTRTIRTARAASVVSFTTSSHQCAAVSSVEAARHFSDKKFKDAPISGMSKKAIKHIYMSDVQAATIEPGIAGYDLLVQAKTGTGKTVAFLLPAIERLVAQSARPINKEMISVLIVSPTRELALQIEKEAKELLKFHFLKVDHAIGGTGGANGDAQRISASRCDILVVTPGRINDMIENFDFASKLADVRTLVLDEADSLLETGFKVAIDKILSALPPKTQGPRQTFLFSATVSPEIKEVARKALREEHKFISTLLPEEMNTHQHVLQSHIVTPFENHLPTLLSILQQDAIENRSASKVMVFFPTARHVSVATEVLEAVKKNKFAAFAGMGPIRQIHSRLTQPARAKAADAFKADHSGILLSSDVTARGMDFPDVTLVVQVGLPSSTEQYVHRLGRTARAGASGRGIIVLSPEESSFLSRPTVRSLGIGATPPPHNLEESQELVNRALTSGQVKDETKTQAYSAWLGYYNGNCKACGWHTKEELVHAAEQYVIKSLGWRRETMPPIDQKAVGMMGLKGLGLNAHKKPSKR